MATISGLNQFNTPNYSALNVSKDPSNSALLNQASSLGINSLDSYYKTDATGNTTGIDAAKLTADIRTAKKAQKEEEEKIELKKQEEIDSFVMTDSGKVTKEEVKTEANKNKISIDKQYEKALKLYAGIYDEYGDNGGTNIEKLEKECNKLKAEHDKLMGSTSSDVQVFNGAGDLLTGIKKFFTKADNVNISEKIKEDNEDVFEIKSRDEIIAEHQPLFADNSNIFDNKYFASALKTSQK